MARSPEGQLQCAAGRGADGIPGRCKRRASLVGDLTGTVRKVVLYGTDEQPWEKTAEALRGGLFGARHRLAPPETVREELVGSHGRWKRPCLQTTFATL